MRRVFVGKSACREQEVTYYLLVEEDEHGEQYGIEVEMGEERVQIASITPIQCRILSLVDRLVQGGVTPVTARDVVLDWLVEEESSSGLLVCDLH